MPSLYPHEVRKIAQGAGAASGFAGFFFPSLRARGLGEEKPAPPYSAIIYKEGDEVRAEDSKGRKIASGAAGVNDASVIQSALNSLTAGRSWKERVVFLGEFDIDMWIDVPSYVILDGGKFMGSGGFKISNSYVEIKNMEATFDESLIAAFYIYIPSGGLLSDIRFHNVRAIDCGRHGFLIDSDSTGSIKNVEFISCKAINCGRYSRFNEWIAGFDLAEQIASIDNLTLIDCEACGCWESGFHMETPPDKYKVLFEGCRACDNGQKPSPVFGYGYLVSGELTMVGCRAIGNSKGGIRIINNDVDYPVSIDVTTKNNGGPGVRIQDTNNLIARINSFGDYEGLSLMKSIDTAYIELQAKNNGGYAFSICVANADWAEKVSNIILKANIVEPAGVSGIATFARTCENFNFDINYYNSQHNLDYGVYFRDARNGVINLNATVTSGTGASLFFTLDKVYVKGVIAAASKAIWLYKTQGLRLSDLSLINAANGIKADGGADITDVVVDLRTIVFEDVSNKLTGDGINSLTIKDENSGTQTFDGDGATKDFLIGAHGLAITDPSKIVVKVTPVSQDAIDASPCIGYVDTSDNSKIRVKFDSAPASGSDNVKITWEAIVI